MDMTQYQGSINECLRRVSSSSRVKSDEQQQSTLQPWGIGNSDSKQQFKISLSGTYIYLGAEYLRLGTHSCCLLLIHLVCSCEPIGTSSFGQCINSGIKHSRLGHTQSDHNVLIHLVCSWEVGHAQGTVGACKRGSYLLTHYQLSSTEVAYQLHTSYSPRKWHGNYTPAIVHGSGIATTHWLLSTHKWNSNYRLQARGIETNLSYCLGSSRIASTSSLLSTSKCNSNYT